MLDTCGRRDGQAKAYTHDSATRSRLAAIFSLDAKMRIKALGELSAGDAPIYGNKACNLARVGAAGLSVPEGFCIPGVLIEDGTYCADVGASACRRRGFKILSGIAAFETGRCEICGY
jgi:hypothetical protein